MMTKLKAFCAVLLCAGCVSGGPTQPDPNVTAAIVKACMSSGLFKAADGTLSAFVPIAVLPVQLINAGVDQVCADPARFSLDITTAEWLVKQLVAAVGPKPGLTAN